MELDSRYHARFDLSDDALAAWRRHACLPRTSAAEREAIYAAASPLLVAAATDLVTTHNWRHSNTSTTSPTPEHLFCIRHPASDDIFLSLPRNLAALFTHVAPCMRMFESVFVVCLDEHDGRVYVAPPLADIFHLLQLLAPGCFALVKADYASHELDDDGEVAWTTWRTFSRALPPPAWMDFHERHLVPIFGKNRWTALRRAATDFEVLPGEDNTFS